MWDGQYRLRIDTIEPLKQPRGAGRAGRAGGGGGGGAAGLFALPVPWELAWLLEGEGEGEEEEEGAKD